MDTFIKIKVFAKSKSQAQEATTKAFQEFKRIELLTNRFPEKGTSEYRKSEIIKINNEAAGQPVPVSKEVFEMLSLAKKYSAETGGAFDVTIGPIMDLWGFGKDKNTVPDEKMLKKALSLVDFNKIVLDEKRHTVFLEQKNMSIDLGGIAKGYATEKAGQVLKELGIKKAIINAGGNIYTIGEREKGLPWKIGIQDPREADKVYAVLNLRDQVAVTSGDFQRFFEVNGKRYHHLLDPKTGKPAEKLMSVTVVAKNSTIADILSSAFFVLGLEKSNAYLEQHSDIQAVFVTPDKKIICSPGLKHIIELTD